MNQTQRAGVSWSSLIDSKKRSKSPFERSLAKSPYKRLPMVSEMDTYMIKKPQGLFQLGKIKL